MAIDTDIWVNKDEVGKNLYRKKTYYTLVVEQEVLAKDKDEADTKFTDHGGLNHSNITKDITDTNVDLMKEFDLTKLNNPVTDIVDSYYIAKYGSNQ